MADQDQNDCERDQEREKNASFWDAAPDIETLLARQGVKPFDWEEWYQKEPAWPEEEEVDEFIAAVRRWRHEDALKKVR